MLQPPGGRWWLAFLLSIMLAGCARKNQLHRPNKTEHSIHVTGIEKALNNFHSVQPGVLYRSAQLSPQFLEKMIKKLGINDNAVSSHKTVRRYPNGASYPVYSFTAAVGFMDAPVATSEKVDARKAELEAQYKCAVHVRYIARD